MDNSECATRCVCRYMSYTGLCTLLSQSLVIAVAAGYGVTSPFSEMLQHKVCSLQGGPCIYLPEVWCWLPVLDKQRHSCSLGMHPCCTIPLTHVLDKAFLPILLTAVQAGVAGLPGKPACHAFQYEMTCCLQCMALAGLYIITTSALDRVSSTAMGLSGSACMHLCRRSRQASYCGLLSPSSSPHASCKPRTCLPSSTSTGKRHQDAQSLFELAQVIASRSQGVAGLHHQPLGTAQLSTGLSEPQSCLCKSQVLDCQALPCA